LGDPHRAGGVLREQPLDLGHRARLDCGQEDHSRVGYQDVDLAGGRDRLVDGGLVGDVEA
jgi:hypothetical protein